MSTESGTRAIVAALSANLGIAVTKFGAFLLTGSSAMLAESVHSLADSGNQVLLLAGGRRARRQATPEHPFGFQRVRYVYAFIVSIVLFTIGGLFALYEAYEKYHEVQSGHESSMLDSRWWWVPLAVLGVALVMEGLSLRTAVRESRAQRGRRSWVEFVRRAKAPELPVVLLEDSAALIGLLFALLGVSLTLVTRNGVWDAVGTAGIGVLLVVVAIVLAVEMASLLIGEAANPDDVRAITAALTDRVDGDVGFERIIHMRTLHLGPEQLLVAAKMAMPPAAEAPQIAAAINAAEARARAAVPDLALVMYLEPDLDALRVDAQRGPGELDSNPSGVGG